MPHLYDSDGPTWRLRLKPVTIWRVMPSQTHLRPIRSITIRNLFENESNFTRMGVNS